MAKQDAITVKVQLEGTEEIAALLTDIENRAVQTSKSITEMMCMSAEATRLLDENAIKFQKAVKELGRKAKRTKRAFKKRYKNLRAKE